MDRTELKKAVETIKNGETLLYPTDTIWGVGCDATNPEAVKKIYQLKERDDSKALVILVAEEWQLKSYVEEVPDIAWDLVEFAERPLTIVYPQGKNLATNLLADDGSVAIRLVKNPFCEELIKNAKVPIVSTSANISGMPSPSRYGEIDERILKGVDYVVNSAGTENKNAVPSQIIKLEVDGEIKFLRK